MDCWQCGQVSHYAQNCPYPNVAENEEFRSGIPRIERKTVASNLATHHLLEARDLFNTGLQVSMVTHYGEEHF